MFRKKFQFFGLAETETIVTRAFQIARKFPLYNETRGIPAEIYKTTPLIFFFFLCTLKNKKINVSDPRTGPPPAFFFLLLCTQAQNEIRFF